MSEMIAETRGLTAAIKELLATEIGRPVGGVHAPLTNDGEVAEKPYIRLWAADSREFFGSPFVSPEEAMCVNYVIGSYGDRDDQVEWLREKVMQTILGKAFDGHGMFANEISYTGHAVIGRSLGLKARIVLQGTTFSAEDIYQFDVTKSS